VTGILDYPHASTTRWRRPVTLSVVLLLHAAVLFFSSGTRDLDSTESNNIVRVIDVPMKRPLPELERIEAPKGFAAAPPPVPAPEFAIEEPELAVIAESANRVQLTPATTSAGNGMPLAGLNGDANAGMGSGAGLGEFTKCTNRVMPYYPRSAMNRGEKGRVTLLVEMDERGKFASISVARSSGSPTLDAAGIDALKRGKCTPVVERGRPVRMFVKQEFDFSLR
jgi:TonB family protein